MPDLVGVTQAVCQQILGGSSARELTSLEAAALERILRSGLTIDVNGVWNFAVPPTFAGGIGIPSAHHTTHEFGGTDPVQLAESQITNLTTDLANKADVSALALKANLNSPNFTGVVTSTIASYPDSGGTARVATTAYVMNVGVIQIDMADGATIAVDPAFRASIWRCVTAGDRILTINPANLTAIPGQKVVIAHKASGGARTLTLDTGTGKFRLPTSITITQTVSGQTDYIGAIYNTNDNKWDVLAYTKGF
jgi:hypothetical protein